MNYTLRIIIFLLYLPLAVNYSLGISRDPSWQSLYVKYVGRMQVNSSLALLFWITDQEILFLFTLQLLMDKCPEIITNFLLPTSHGRWENIQMIKSTVLTCFDFTGSARYPPPQPLSRCSVSACGSCFHIQACSG